MRSIYYDIDGKPIDINELSIKFEDKNYRRIAFDFLPNGCEVSTVWLGIDHGILGDYPVIFETMVFSSNWEFSVDMDRYSTKRDAIIGHKKMVAKWAGDKSNINTLDKSSEAKND